MRIKNTPKILDRIDSQAPRPIVSDKRSHSPDNFVMRKKNFFVSPLSLNQAKTLNLSLETTDASRPWWSDDAKNSLKKPVSISLNNQKIFLDTIHLFDLLKAVSKDKNYLMDTII